MLLSHLSPETITQINLEDEEDEYDDLHGATDVCLSRQCQATISGARCPQLLQLSWRVSAEISFVSIVYIAFINCQLGMKKVTALN